MEYLGKGTLSLFKEEENRSEIEVLLLEQVSSSRIFVFRLNELLNELMYRTVRHAEDTQ